MFPLTPFREQSRGRSQKEPFYFQAPMRAVWESPGSRRPLGEKAVCPLWSGCQLWEGLDRRREQKGAPGGGCCRHKGLGPPPSPSPATTTTTAPGQPPCQERSFTGSIPFSFPICLQEAQASIRPSYRWENWGSHRLRTPSRSHSPESRFKSGCPSPCSWW